MDNLEKDNAFLMGLAKLLEEHNKQLFLEAEDYEEDECDVHLSFKKKNCHLPHSRIICKVDKSRTYCCLTSEDIKKLVIG